MKRSEFLSEIFPVELLHKDESPLIAYPDTFTDSDGLLHSYHRQTFWQPRVAGLDSREEGWLFCVSTVKRNRKARRRFVDVQRAFVVPCDDVGSKSEVPPVAPSYIVETSPENFQYGYLIDPFDVSQESEGGAEYYDGVLFGLANAGYNDPGCRSATRVIKLPGSVHHSGFVTRLVEWRPERSWDLAELVAEMGIEVATVVRKTYHSKPVRYVRLEDIADATYRWLVDNGLTYGGGSGGFINIK